MERMHQKSWPVILRLGYKKMTTSGSGAFSHPLPHPLWRKLPLERPTWEGTVECLWPTAREKLRSSTEQSLNNRSLPIITLVKLKVVPPSVETSQETTGQTVYCNQARDLVLQRCAENCATSLTHRQIRSLYFFKTVSFRVICCTAIENKYTVIKETKEKGEKFEEKFVYTFYFFSCKEKEVNWLLPIVLKQWR